jgi:Domain of unknown function (DUF4396)
MTDKLDLLRLISIVSIVMAAICALAIVVHIAIGNRQRMWIMNLVWPITALYSGPLGLAAYFMLGRTSANQKQTGKENDREKSFWQSVGVGALHCGAGCSLGDLIAEWFLFFVPLTIFGKKIFAAWIVDYVLAFLIGIVFQYFTIKPMKSLSVREGLIAALKADTLSLTAWQVGMYGWMASVVFIIFGHELEKTDPIFWFMMQLAMLGGFVTSYPVNWWLLRKGIKEPM